MSEVPSLAALFWGFMRIGMQSFGGGLSGWIRREVVQQQKWLTDRQFLSGLALSQIAPGANAVNVAVFVGTTLRGAPGACAAIAGLMLLPFVLILALGMLYFSHAGLPHLETVLSGLGWGAIGLTLATGMRMAGRAARRVREAAIVLVTTVAIGVLHFELLPVLLVMVPVSFALRRFPRP